MKLRPLHDRVSSSVLEESQDRGRIVIPDTATEKPIQGEVLAVGPGKILENGDVRPLDVKSRRQGAVRQVLRHRRQGRRRGAPRHARRRHLRRHREVTRSHPDKSRRRNHGSKRSSFSATTPARACSTGVNILANAVKVTLGPKGRNVVLEKSFGAPTVTKDGVSVAKEIELKDKFENMGAQMVKEVASQDLRRRRRRHHDRDRARAGDRPRRPEVRRRGHEPDGPEARHRQGRRRRWSKSSRSCRKPTQGPARRSPRSARSRPTATRTIGKIIAEAMDKVGKEGVITVEEGKPARTELEVVEGMQFDRGYLSPYFINNQRAQSAELEDPFILLHDKKISEHPRPAADAREVAKSGQAAADRRRGSRRRSARDARREHDPRHRQGRRRQGAGLRRSPQGDARGHRDPDRRPGHLRGSRPDAREGELKDLGQAKQVRSSTRKTPRSSTAPAQQPTSRARIKQIRAQIEETTSDYDKEKLQERVAKLAGGVAVIKVGAATEIEMKEKKARVEDALHATRAAVEEGIVAGGGVALPALQQAHRRRSRATTKTRTSASTSLSRDRRAAASDRRERRRRARASSLERGRERQGQLRLQRRRTASTAT